MSRSTRRSGTGPGGVSSRVSASAARDTVTRASAGITVLVAIVVIVVMLVLVLLVTK